MTTTIIHSVLVFDGLSVHRLPSMVCINGDSGLIEWVKPMEDASHISEFASSNSLIVDGEGCTLIPGLIDAHVHVHGFHLPSGIDNSRVLEQPLRCGITTVCDMHCDPDTIGQLRTQVEEEIKELRRAGICQATRITQSDIRSCHYAATIRDGWPKPVVMASGDKAATLKKISDWPNVTPENAGDFVRARLSEGADYIKIMQEDGCCFAMETDSIPSASMETQRAVAQAAHEYDMTVIAHASSLENTIMVLEAGADGLAHTICDQRPTKGLVDLYKRTGAFVVPTLAVISSACNEERQMRERIATVALKKGIINSTTRNIMLESMQMAASTSKTEYAYESVRQLKKEGIDILAGTDSSPGMHGMAIGPSLWMELEQYVTKCDMTASEALTAATETVARRLGLPDRGSVLPGRRADLVLIRGKPFETIQCIWEGEGIIGVWKDGVRAV